MEIKGSLPHSQEPGTHRYPQSVQSSPFPHPTVQRSILILSSHLRLGLLIGLLPSVFPVTTAWPICISLLARHLRLLILVIGEGSSENVNYNRVRRSVSFMEDNTEINVRRRRDMSLLLFQEAVVVLSEGR
jgi:hypothetical protein